MHACQEKDGQAPHQEKDAQAPRDEKDGKAPPSAAQSENGPLPKNERAQAFKLNVSPGLHFAFIRGWEEELAFALNSAESEIEAANGSVQRVWPLGMGALVRYVIFKPLKNEPVPGVFHEAVLPRPFIGFRAKIADRAAHRAIVDDAAKNGDLGDLIEDADSLYSLARSVSRAQLNAAFSKYLSAAMQALIDFRRS